MVNTFNLTIKDIRVQDDKALKRAKYNRHVKLVNWLTNKFNIDIKSVNM